MDMQERKTNYYTKELNEIDRYLLQIIKRYFDLEEINSTASINAIMSEAIARYKATIRYEPSAVTVLNNKVGIVNIDTNELNLERKFEKNTAFNKDFGITENTICSGDDERLYDLRQPTVHVHKISNITDLLDTIDSFKKELVYYGNHLHKNLAILNKLKYTGTKTQIDLIELETIGSIVVRLTNMLEVKRQELIMIYSSNAEIIEDLLQQVYLHLERVYNYVHDMDTIVQNDLQDYILKTSIGFDSLRNEMINIPGKTEVSSIIEAFNNTLLLTSTEEIKVSDVLDFIDGTVNSDNGQSMKDLYTNSSAIGISNGSVIIYDEDEKKLLWSFDDALNTFVCNVNYSEHLMFLSGEKYHSYSHSITVKSTDLDNDVITIILGVYRETYEEEEKIYTLSLNISTGLDGFTNSPHKFCLVYGYQTDAQEELAYDDTFNPTENWAAYDNGVSVRIERELTKIKI